MPAPMVDLDGKTYVMSEGETGQLTQSGPVVVISRREVEAVLERMQQRVDRNWPDAKKLYGDKIKAYQSLLDQGSKK